MKKNLLTLSLVVASITTYAQTAQNTYIGDKAIVKVQPNTLFYNGGDLKILSSTASETPNIVKNSGNIQVEGDFTNSITSTTGKEFVNQWTSVNDYGQLIIKDDAITTGKVALERSLPKVGSIDEYIIALPFKGNAIDVYNSITNFSLSNPTGLALAFKGECNVNSNCYTRYDQSLFEWDNAETEYDAVKSDTPINPIKRYLLNTRNNSNLKQAVQYIDANTSNKNISFAGSPSNKEYTITLKSGLKPVNGNAFYHEDLQYSQWKNNRNNYREIYDTYLGNQQNSAAVNSNKLYGKNLHRLANPYTSNLDLSDVSKTNSWIKFNIAGTDQTPTEAYTGAIRFRLFKLANDFQITWNSEEGNTSTSSNTTSFNAFLSKDTNGSNPTPYFWTGSPEALLIKPYETFYIDYYTLSRTVNGNSRIIEAEITLGDKQKTFSKEYLPANGSQIGGVFARNSTNTKLNSLLNDDNLKSRGLVTDFDFTQLELYLSENNSIKGNAAYLLNANFMTTGNETANKTASNPVFFYEETNEGNVALNAETISNYFNSEDYIGKPLRVGFRNLTVGNEYQINLNLYEFSILNKVENLTLGRYYLLDKVTNTVSEVNATTQVVFTANDNINDRFEFYWNEEPRTLSTIDVNKNATYIYKAEQNQFIRFEDKNTTALVEIYDITGRLINKVDKVNTSIDHKLNLANVPSIYVVVITYNNGKIVTKKTINKY